MDTSYKEQTKKMINTEFTNPISMEKLENANIYIERRIKGLKTIHLEQIHKTNERIYSIDSQQVEANSQFKKIIEKENNQFEIVKSKINAYLFFIESNERYMKNLNTSVVRHGLKKNDYYKKINEEIFQIRKYIKLQDKENQLFEQLKEIRKKNRSIFHQHHRKFNREMNKELLIVKVK